MPYLITYPTELLDDLLFGASECIWIVKSYMQTLPHLADKRRATLLGSTTHGDDIIPTLVKILRDILGIMGTDVNPYLSHYLDGKRMDLRCRPYSCRTDFRLRMKTLKDAVGHLTAASVAGA